MAFQASRRLGTCSLVNMASVGNGLRQLNSAARGTDLIIGASLFNYMQQVCLGVGLASDPGNVFKISKESRSNNASVSDFTKSNKRTRTLPEDYYLYPLGSFSSTFTLFFNLPIVL